MNSKAMEGPGAAAATDAAAPDTREYDGVICFGGEDWWYHNRAHYDMQMMREFSAHVPVLYVNSIGMRVPTVTEGGMFFRRVIRKLKSFSRGTVRVRDRFSVQSPVVIPGRRGMAISGWLLPRQVRRAARRMGIQRPLVWVACPPGIEAAEALDPVGLVYQRTDRFETYEGVDRDLIRSFHERLRAKADIVLHCSRHLHHAEVDDMPQAVFVDHGVDFTDFVAAGDHPDAAGAEAPRGIHQIPGPRVGFVGDVDSAVFDHELLLGVARRLPEVQFVLIGGCTLPEGWNEGVHNIHFVDRVPYEEVAAVMASQDVLIMPWHRSEWIEACNPIKLKEYLATGRPVVSTDFPELRHYEGLLDIANDAEGFAKAVEAALDPSSAAELAERTAAGRARVAEASWTSRADAAIEALAARGLRISTRRPGK